MNTDDLLTSAKQKANEWLNSPSIDEATKKQIKGLLDAPQPDTLINSFYKNLEFGTGGLRGIMGAGSNCINKYTIGIATQGLANYLKKELPNQPLQVAVAYDSRNNSKYFAEITANVFSANGIVVHLFKELRPTPLLSFAIRHLKCQSGVVITASHNPKEYNGYKAYWSDGAQLVNPHDNNVIKEVNSILDFNQILFEPDTSKIKMIGLEIDKAYYKELLKIIPNQDIIKTQKDIPIVYSNIHGAGITMIPECLKLLGFENVSVVEEQKVPDGNFPTVKSPNPEEASSMALALKLAKKKNAELAMATDPDTDRVGIAIKNDNGNFVLLNGNQALSLMVWFILSNLKDKKNTYIAKTIVTSDFVDAMANQMGVECINTLTGFKYIAELVRKNEGNKRFIVAGEESYGYMVGDFVRDKDAVSACAFFATMVATARSKDQTLYGWMKEMYKEYGLYKEKIVNVVLTGAEGENKINYMMKNFRSNPPKILGGQKVVKILDYKFSVEKTILTGYTKPINLPKSDVLQFKTWEGSKISVRPSGTEPKIKFYISVTIPLTDPNLYESAVSNLDDKIKIIEKEISY